MFHVFFTFLFLISPSSLLKAQAPNWTVTPSQFQYQTTVTAVVEVDFVPETDAQNRLAMFKGNQVRGVASPILLLGNGYYFLQVYSNAISDTLTVKLYDASTATIRTLSAPFYFRQGDAKGTIEKPEKFQFINQFNLPPKWNNKLIDVNLETGESIPSVNLANRVSDPENNALGFSVAGNSSINVSISAPGNAAFSYPNGFTGSESIIFTVFETANPTNLARDTVQISIAPVDLPPVAVAGKNLTVFANETAPEVDLQQHFYSPDGQVLRFSAEPALATAPVTRPNWQLNASAFQLSMNVTAAVQFYGFPATGNNLLGAFVGNQLRGVASPQVVNGKTVYFLTVYANTNGEQVRFQIWHEASQSFASAFNTRVFNPLSPGGSFENPLEMQFGGVNLGVTGSLMSVSPKTGFSGSEKMIVRAIETGTAKSLSAQNTFLVDVKSYARPEFRLYSGQSVLDAQPFSLVDLDTLITPVVESEVSFSVSRIAGTALSATIQTGNLFSVQPEKDQFGSATFRLVASLVSSGEKLDSLDISYSRAASLHTLTLNGPEGWRMLSSAVPTTFAQLLDATWTQGIQGSDTQNGAPNVLLFNGTSFSAPENLQNQIAPGSGFLVNVYEDDDVNTPGVQGGFPKTIQVSGLENASPVSFSPNSGSGKYSLAGNPFSSTIDWDLVTKSNLSNTVYVYDPVYTAENTGDQQQSVGGAYRAWNGSVGGQTDGLIAPFQGFWVQALGDAPSLTFETAHKSSGAIFRGKEENNVQKIRLSVSHEKGSNDAWIHFSEIGKSGFDAWDGWKLYPLTSRYLLLNSGFANGYGLDINHLPKITERTEIPFDLETSETGVFELKLEAHVTDDMTFGVFDSFSGETVRLQPGERYVFEMNKTSKANPTARLLPTKMAQNKDPRFTLIITPGTSTASSDMQAVKTIELRQNYPNPFNPTTTIQFTLPEASQVQLSIFDLNGRMLAKLMEGRKTAGTHAIAWNAEKFSSGVYLVRLQADGKMLQRKMTLLK